MQVESKIITPLPARQQLQDVLVRIRNSLGLNSNQFAKLLNCSTNTVTRQEECTTAANLNHKYLQAILKISERDFPQAGLVELKSELVEVVYDIKGRGINARLYCWSLEVEREAFESAVGCKINHLTGRPIPNFDHLKQLAVSFLGSPNEPELFWRSERGEQAKSAILETARSLGRPTAIQTLIMAVECLGSKISSDVAANNLLDTTVDFGTRVEINHFRFTPKDTVENLFRSLKNKGIFTEPERSEISEAFEQGFASQAKWFHERLGLLAKQRNIGNAFLAECLGADHTREKVYKYLDGRTSYSSLPFAQLAYLVARTESEATRLINQAVDDITDDQKKIQGTKVNSDIYALRLVWGVKFTELDKFDPHELKKLEETNTGKLVDQKERVLKAIIKLGKVKLIDACARYVEKVDRNTVKGFYRVASDLLGVAEFTKECAVSPNTLRKYRSGACLPDLRQLKENEVKCPDKLQASDLLEIDWRDKYPKLLKAYGETDLARVVYTLIAEQSSSPTEFFRAKKCDFFKAQECLTKILHFGHLPDPEFRAFIADIGIDPNSLQGKYMLAVNQSGSIAVALNSVCRGRSIEDRNLLAQLRDNLTGLLDSDQSVFEQKFRTQTRFLAKKCLAAQALPVLRSLPGATFSEVLASSKLPRRNSFFKSTFQKVLARGISAEMFAYAAEARHEAITKYKPEDYLAALSLERVSNLFPPALLAYCSVNRRENLSDTRAAFRSLTDLYRSAGVEPTDLMLAVAYYGVKIEQIKSVSFEQAQLLLQGLVADSRMLAKVLEEVEEIGTASALRAVEKVINLLLPDMKDLIEYYQFCHRGMQASVNLQAGINNRLEVDYANQVKTPSLPRFNRMLTASGNSMTTAWEIAWYVNFAKYGLKNYSPLERVFFGKLMSGKFEGASEITSLQQPDRRLNKFPVEEQIAKQRSEVMGVDPFTLRRLFRELKANKLSDQMLTLALNILNEDPGKEFGLFFRELCRTGQLSDSVISSIKRTSGSYNYTYLRTYHIREQANFFDLTTDTAAQDALRFFENYPGISTQEAVGIADILSPKTREASSTSLSTSPRSSLSDYMQAIKEAESFKTKLQILAEAKKAGVNLNPNKLISCFEISDTAYLQILLNVEGAAFIDTAIVLLRMENPKSALISLINNILGRKEFFSPEELDFAEYVEKVYLKLGKLIDHRSLFQVCFE